MLETVEAERFDGDAQGGATIPTKMGCRRENGTHLDAFVKCSSPQCAPGGLAREIVGCLLAQKLGLICGSPVLVNLDPDLIEQIRSVSPSSSARMRGSVSPAFGSVALGSGFTLCNGIDFSNPTLRQTALEIWAFDQLVMNPDRNAKKPNCLVKGDVLAVIDHEKALVVYGIGGLVPAPWQQNWVPEKGHLFHDLVMGGPRNLDRLKEAWANISEDEIDQIMSAVPRDWGAQDVIDSIRNYLLELRQNIETAFDNLQRAYE